MELWDYKLINRCMVTAMVAWCFLHSAWKLACDRGHAQPFLHAALGCLRGTCCMLVLAVLTCMHTILCSNSSLRMPAATRLQGIVTVPLSDLMSKNSIRETYRLEGAKNGHLALDLKYVSVLNGS